MKANKLVKEDAELFEFIKIEKYGGIIRAFNPDVKFRL